MPSVTRAETDSRAFLRQIISTVASSLELDEVLRSVVRLLSEGSSVHACFVYLVEDGGKRLVLRAAGEPYEHLIGDIVLERPRGLAWWAAERNEPAFIPENLLDDPRVEYVPELEEEKFQSLLSVPIAARDGTVIGVISAHTEAPHAFTRPRSSSSSRAPRWWLGRSRMHGSTTRRERGSASSRRSPSSPR